MSGAVSDLLSILDLEQLEHNLFRGRSPQSGWQRVFGGQVIGQALVAAARTAAIPAHSLHAYFLLPGDPEVPIIYEVERIRDGKSFSTRRVVAIQHGRPIFTMAASFHREEEGFDHQIDMPLVPRPDELPDEALFKRTMLTKLPEPVRRYFERDRPVEIRPTDPSRYLGTGPGEPVNNVWIRSTARLPDDPAIHKCVLAYASDFTLLDTSLAAHGRTLYESDIVGASLDHALWFHRPFRADDWLLFAQDSPSASGALGFARGRIYSEAGVLVASVAQEGVVRQRREPAP